MATREQIYDYCIAEELPDGTVRYWMEDQWRAEHGDFEYDQEGSELLGRGPLEKHLQAVGRVLWLVLKGAAFFSWHVLRIAWKVLWIVVFVFCFQNLVGSAIALSRK